MKCKKLYFRKILKKKKKQIANLRWKEKITEWWSQKEHWKN